MFRGFKVFRVFLGSKRGLGFRVLSLPINGALLLEDVLDCDGQLCTMMA